MRGMAKSVKKSAKSSVERFKERLERIRRGDTKAQAMRISRSGDHFWMEKSEARGRVLAR